MSQISDTPQWLVSVLGTIGAAAVIALIRRVLVGVTRQELREQYQDMQAERLRMHTENLERFDKLDERTERLEDLAGDVRRIKDDIGNHETGIRGMLHEHAQMLTRHEIELERLKKQ